MRKAKAIFASRPLIHDRMHGRQRAGSRKFTGRIGKESANYLGLRALRSKTRGLRLPIIATVGPPIRGYQAQPTASRRLDRG